MRPAIQNPVRVAIGCGGTGGHLFPGLAVAGQLVQRGCAVSLMISPKEVDQKAVRQARDVEVVTLPAIGLTRANAVAFVRAFWRSYSVARAHFRPSPPHAVLAMGGFTSAPPLLAAKRSQARAFLHESNSIPGRANRWLSWMVDQAFVGFPEAGYRLHARQIAVTGTPVRAQFRLSDPASCRTALGLDPARPVLLVMGGSQGASGVNRLVAKVLPALAAAAPTWQWIHLTGAGEAEHLRGAYSKLGVRSIVQPFLAEMELAMGAATLAVSRAGASSLAELAAMRLPAILVPFPAAADDHQRSNAQAFEQSGAARMIDQATATPDHLVNVLSSLMTDESGRAAMQTALARWHAPRAAEEIAELIMAALSNRTAQLQPAKTSSGHTPPETSGPRDSSRASLASPRLRSGGRGREGAGFLLPAGSGRSS
jgi:UDP-N-acetylglucosamine--N-acetylmuramyl-(pentapeptide) pyrophosphoryl-undecaprenol N-acetylglucosamine transferase